MDTATKVVVWAAAAVVIAAGITFLANDSADKNAAKEVECREKNLTVQMHCWSGGMYSEECLKAVRTCVKRGY